MPLQIIYPAQNISKMQIKFSLKAKNNNIHDGDLRWTVNKVLKFLCCQGWLILTQRVCATKHLNYLTKRGKTNTSVIGLTTTGCKVNGRNECDWTFFFLPTVITIITETINNLGAKYSFYFVFFACLSEIQAFRLLQVFCYLGKRHSGTLVIIYPLLCNVSLNIKVKQ